MTGVIVGGTAIRCLVCRRPAPIAGFDFNVWQCRTCHARHCRLRGVGPHPVASATISNIRRRAHRRVPGPR